MFFTVLQRPACHDISLCDEVCLAQDSPYAYGYRITAYKISLSNNHRFNSESLSSRTYTPTHYRTRIIKSRYITIINLYSLFCSVIERLTVDLLFVSFNVHTVCPGSTRPTGFTVVVINHAFMIW